MNSNKRVSIRTRLTGRVMRPCVGYFRLVDMVSIRTRLTGRVMLPPGGTLLTHPVFQSAPG